MTADHAIPLKMAWELMRCPRRLVLKPPGKIVAQPYCGKDKGYCKGHVALLEMVDTIHLPGCNCRAPSHHDSHQDRFCIEERRRLRAAVGVEEGKK